MAIKSGAEGLILQKFSSPYERGRTSELLKLKAVRGDQEALVVGIEEDSASLQLPDGIIFSAPLPPDMPITPKIGNIVTFSYQNYARHEIPVSPQIQRVRFDVSWKDVVSDFIQHSTSNPPELNDVTKKVAGQTMKPKGYWNSNSGRNLRITLENFASQRNFDHLIPENWYNVHRSELLEMIDISLERYNGSLIRALKETFPELIWDDAKFHFVPKKHWSNEMNRREVFDSFAKENGFDPLVADSWYFVSPTALREAKGVSSMLVYYQGSTAKALLHLYPNIGLDIRKFANVPRVLHWSDPDNHRVFFDSIAAQSKFDPLTPENWYSISSYQISAKGGNVLLNHYKGSLAHALRNVYPHIGLDLSRFS